MRDGVLRIAISVIAMSATIVLTAVGILLVLTGEPLERVLFEVVSAFATVGLSTGITARLPEWGQWILIGLMYLGRIGPITMVSALAARQRGRRYDLPAERPLIG